MNPKVSTLLVAVDGLDVMERGYQGRCLGEVDKFQFTINEEEVTFTLHDLRTVFKLPQATANNHVEFMEAPEIGTMIKFFNILGHAVVIRLAGQFYTKSLPQPWQTLGKVVMRCLTTRITGIDQPPLHIMQMFYCIINNVYVDYASLIWEVKQIDLDNMNEAQILSYTLRKSAQEAEAQANVKLVEQYLLDEDINKIVEGDDADANEFADTVLLKEEASDEAALILKKGKNVMEDKDTPITTPTRSPRITLSLDKEKLQELMDNVSPSSKVPPSPSSI
ncbi:hypothetical protein Tco_1031499 [Tanacetum coccineum]|uniref:Uncharacterized protein n=1 Tax=Tanacetum coccineum TaxID=301880 RepID=A0ABQ5GA95_9ASTR